MRAIFLQAAAASILFITLVGCGAKQAAPMAAAPTAPESTQEAKQGSIEKIDGIERIPTRHLLNAVRVHDKVISGGLPESADAFAELQALGVKTVISVDGARPDLATAEKYGLRYVHLPHGYDGVPEKRVAELAKAVRELPGQIYIHCHHGKHRSPAATAVACVSAGLIGKEDALRVLKVAGTSEHYRGLFESTHSAHPLDVALLDKLQFEFPGTAKLPAMAEAMVEIEHVHDHLKSLEQGGWKVLAQKPDLLPAHEALLLREHFTELLRTEEVKQLPDQFQQLMKAAATNAQELEDSLRASSSKAETPASDAVSKSFKKVSDNCKACHEQFRDVPLSEKGKNAIAPSSDRI